MPAIVRKNERSWAISLISDINIKLQRLGLQIVRAGGEATISTEHQSMFPDVLLYGDENQTQILQGWELKLPDTSITDITFINDAKRKAISLKLNSFFIWNFSAGVLYTKTNNNDFKIFKQWNDTNHIQTRADVEKYRKDWLPAIEKILLEINEYLLTNAIRGSEIGEIISDTIIATIIKHNKILVSEKLKHACLRNNKIEAYISNWWNSVQDEFISDEQSMFSAYAKVILLSWTNRILFAHLIKYSHNAAMKVNNLSFETTIIEANAIFKEITANCDFYNIFEALEYNDILPQKTWLILMDLNVFLRNNGIIQIEQATLQNILETTVATSKREVNGVFTTPNILADILVRLTTRDWTGQAIDPCCGTGTIPKAILHQKKLRLNNVLEAVNTTWASDKFAFPLQIANISMTNIDTINIPSKIFKKNVFNLNKGDKIQIINPANGEYLKFDLPSFKTIVSNLPFVPFEKIPSEDWTHIEKICEMDRETINTALSNRNDYYSFIIFALHKILDNGGRLGVITSNSWLGTVAGREFYHELGCHYKVEQVHISNSSRWFDNAKIITVILILTKKALTASPKAGEKTTFCSWQKDLNELKENKKSVETIVNSALLNQQLDPKVIKLKTYTNAEIVSLCAMNLSLSALFHNVSWLLDIADKLTPISNVLKVIRGERRGWDEMFYPATNHGIEQCYIKKVLKSSRAITSLFAETDKDAFCCSKSIEELQKLNHSGALSWIRRFESAVNNTGKPLPQVLSRKNLQWYEMKNSNVVDMVTTMNPDQRLFFARFKTSSFINQRLIGLQTTTENSDIDLYHALLNSLIGMFYIESVGFGRGLGALDINSNAIKNAYMLKPDIISKHHRDSILKKFTPLLQRKVYSTKEELFKSDRIEFDYEVLRAYGIERYYDNIKNSLLSMQKMRLGVR